MSPVCKMTILDFLYVTFNLCVMSHWFPEIHVGGKFWPPRSPILIHAISFCGDS